MEEFREEAVFEFRLGGHVEEVEVGEVESFFDEGDSAAMCENFVAKFEFVP